MDYSRAQTEAAVALYLRTRSPEHAPDLWHAALLIAQLQLDVAHLRVSASSAISNLSNVLDNVNHAKRFLGNI